MEELRRRFPGKWITLQRSGEAKIEDVDVDLLKRQFPTPESTLFGPEGIFFPVARLVGIVGLEKAIDITAKTRTDQELDLVLRLMIRFPEESPVELLETVRSAIHKEPGHTSRPAYRAAVELLNSKEALETTQRIWALTINWTGDASAYFGYLLYAQGSISSTRSDVMSAKDHEEIAAAWRKMQEDIELDKQVGSFSEANLLAAARLAVANVRTRDVDDDEGTFSFGDFVEPTLSFEDLEPSNESPLLPDEDNANLLQDGTDEEEEPPEGAPPKPAGEEPNAGQLAGPEEKKDLGSDFGSRFQVRIQEKPEPWTVPQDVRGPAKPPREADFWRMLEPAPPKKSTKKKQLARTECPALVPTMPWFSSVAACESKAGLCGLRGNLEDLTRIVTRADRNLFDSKDFEGSVGWRYDALNALVARTNVQLDLGALHWLLYHQSVFPVAVVLFVENKIPCPAVVFGSPRATSYVVLNRLGLNDWVLVVRRCKWNFSAEELKTLLEHRCPGTPIDLAIRDEGQEFRRRYFFPDDASMRSLIDREAPLDFKEAANTSEWFRNIGTFRTTALSNVVWDSKFPDPEDWLDKALPDLPADSHATKELLRWRRTIQLLIEVIKLKARDDPATVARAVHWQQILDANLSSVFPERDRRLETEYHTFIARTEPVWRTWPNELVPCDPSERDLATMILTSKIMLLVLRFGVGKYLGWKTFGYAFDEVLVQDKSNRPISKFKDMDFCKTFLENRIAVFTLMHEKLPFAHRVFIRVNKTQIEFYDPLASPFAREMVVDFLRAACPDQVASFEFVQMLRKPLGETQTLHRGGPKQVVNLCGWWLYFLVAFATQTNQELPVWERAAALNRTLFETNPESSLQTAKQMTQDLFTIAQRWLSKARSQVQN